MVLRVIKSFLGDDLSVGEARNNSFVGGDGDEAQLLKVVGWVGLGRFRFPLRDSI